MQPSCTHLFNHRARSITNDNQICFHQTWRGASIWMLAAVTNEHKLISGEMTKPGAPRGGYSDTPLAKKLGIKAGHRLAMFDAPNGWAIPDLPDDVELAVNVTSKIDVAVAFFCDAAAIASDVADLSARIFPAGSLWIAWPRKAAGHVSDISENLLREIGLPLGIVDVKVAALDENWSGLKFVWRVEYRALSSPPLLKPAIDG